LRSTLPAEPSVLLLYGEPGAGKSTLALQFAWETQKDFDVVMFQTCGRAYSMTSPPNWSSACPSTLRRSRWRSSALPEIL